MPVGTATAAPELAEIGTQPSAWTLPILPTAAAGNDEAVPFGRRSRSIGAQTLHRKEALRTRSFLRTVTVLSVVALIGLPLLGGHSILAAVLALSLTACAGLSFWLHHQLRDPSRYHGTRVIAVAMVCAITAIIGVLFWGVFSSAAAYVVFGLYFFCCSQSRRPALLVYATCAVGHALAAMTIVLGLIADPGLFSAGDNAMLTQAAVQLAVVQFAYLFSFISAQASRQATLGALEQMQSDVRETAARDTFEQAGKELTSTTSIGGSGRYTGQLIGSFQLGIVIGRGGMGEIYEAEHMFTGEPAAVKLLYAHLAHDPEMVARFMCEAEAAGALSSPHVVRVFEASKLDASPVYLAMERLEGRDMESHLEDGLMSLAQVTEVVRQVGSVIDKTSAEGIVHRDLKPQNVFLDTRGGLPTWKVLDFGVSKIAGSGNTLTGSVLGTPAYIAPEQASGRSVDHRADLYALSAIAYRALTGRSPFEGSAATMVYQAVHQMPVQPSRLGSMPPDVERVLAIGLAKDPRDRFASGDELAKAFATASDGALDRATRDRADALIALRPWRTR